MTSNSRADISWHLLGYPFVFAFYLWSGVSRRRTYGRAASKLKWIVMALAGYVAIWSVYWLLWAPRTTGSRRIVANGIFLFLVLLLMVLYRSARILDRRSRWKRRPLIGVDIDGVLADQITGLLPRIKLKYGLSLAYNDVTEWRLRVGESDIAQEISDAISDPGYVSGMRAHTGAEALMNLIDERAHGIVITARPAPAIDETVQWLRNKNLRFERIVTCEEARKSGHGIEVLIDDYIGNVFEYVSNSEGIGILIDQPWNRERGCLTQWLQSGRLLVASDLAEAKELLVLILERDYGQRRALEERNWSTRFRDL